MFFALLAILTVAFLRPLGPMQWFGFLASIAFVAAGGFALWRGDRPPARGLLRPAANRHGGQAAAIERFRPFEFDADEIGEPTLEERHVLETTLAALSGADALAAGEVDAVLMWRAARYLDPDEPVGFVKALHSLASLHEFGRLAAPRLAFVPVQVEYDAALLAEITASVLTALGHTVVPNDVSVMLPRDGSQGEATIAFTLAGRQETIACDFLWKYPPPGLIETLLRFRRTDDPRDLVCADVSSGTLLLAAIRPGSLDELNRRFPVGYDMFGAP